MACFSESFDRLFPHVGKDPSQLVEPPTLVGIASKEVGGLPCAYRQLPAIDKKQAACPTIQNAREIQATYEGDPPRRGNSFHGLLKLYLCRERRASF